MIVPTATVTMSGSRLPTSGRKAKLRKGKHWRLHTRNWQIEPNRAASHCAVLWRLRSAAFTSPFAASASSALPGSFRSLHCAGRAGVTAQRISRCIQHIVQKLVDCVVANACGVGRSVIDKDSPFLPSIQPLLKTTFETSPLATRSDEIASRFCVTPRGAPTRQKQIEHIARPATCCAHRAPTATSLARLDGSWSRRS